MRCTAMLSVCLLIAAGGIAIASPIQWEAGLGGNGHWYEYVQTTGLAWSEAGDAAASSTWQGQQGYLATITSADENAWISQNILGSYAESFRLWLGGYQDTAAPDYSEPAGGWLWVTGEAWSYTNWGVSSSVTEPNNCSDSFFKYPEDYLEIICHLYTNSPTGWNDAYPATTPMSQPSAGYLVEYGAVPEPAPILALLCGIGGLLAGPRRRR